MFKRIPQTTVKRVRTGAIIAGAVCTFLAAAAQAQEPAQPGAGEAPPAAPVPVETAVPPPEPAPPSPAPVSPPPASVTTAPAAVTSAPVTDHELVVGKWGVDIRHLGTFQRTHGQERGCDEDCPMPMNAIGVRRWSSSGFGWNAGMAIAVGGGSGRRDGDVRRWDTFVGFGPTVGTSFLLASWKHLAISAGPQLDALVFMPSRRGSKSFLVNLRGVLEGEFHLGVIGFPEASISTSSGIQASFLYATEHQTLPMDRDTALKWSVTVSGPQAVWELVTKVQLRYYF